MPKEYTKEKLISLRLYVTIAATLDSACIAWFASHFKSANILLHVYNILAIIILTIIFTFLTIKLVKDSKQLKGVCENE